MCGLCCCPGGGVEGACGEAAVGSIALVWWLYLRLDWWLLPVAWTTAVVTASDLQFARVTRLYGALNSLVQVLFPVKADILRILFKFTSAQTEISCAVCSEKACCIPHRQNLGLQREGVDVALSPRTCQSQIARTYMSHR